MVKSGSSVNDTISQRTISHFVILYERTLLVDRKIVLDTYGGTISIPTSCIQKRNIQKNYKLTNIQSRELNVLLSFDTKWKI